MKDGKTLADLIGCLQSSVANKKVTLQVIDDAKGQLSDLGFKQYDLKKFPKLSGTASFSGGVSTSPQSLAEALLWKLGKWTTYQTFVRNFIDENLQVSSRGGVVFSAFAKHLQDNENPIYDQHAIRALWAICKFTEEESQKCKSLLFDGRNNWKDAGSGDDGSCYVIFVNYVREICDDEELSNDDLDRLLMPLGQAIKKETKNGARSPQSEWERFKNLCWPSK